LKSENFSVCSRASQISTNLLFVFFSVWIELPFFVWWPVNLGLHIPLPQLGTYGKSRGKSAMGGVEHKNSIQKDSGVSVGTTHNLHTTPQPWFLFLFGSCCFCSRWKPYHGGKKAHVGTTWQGGATEVKERDEDEEEEQRLFGGDD